MVCSGAYADAPRWAMRVFFVYWAELAIGNMKTVMRTATCKLRTVFLRRMMFLSGKRPRRVNTLADWRVRIEQESHQRGRIFLSQILLRQPFHRGNKRVN